MTPPRLILFEPLQPGSFVPAGRPQRGAPYSPQLLSLRHQGRVDFNPDVAQVFEPLNGLVDFLDDLAQLRDEFSL